MTAAAIVLSVMTLVCSAAFLVCVVASALLLRMRFPLTTVAWTLMGAAVTGPLAGMLAGGLVGWY